MNYLSKLYLFIFGFLLCFHSNSVVYAEPISFALATNENKVSDKSHVKKVKIVGDFHLDLDGGTFAQPFAHYFKTRKVTLVTEATPSQLKKLQAVSVIPTEFLLQIPFLAMNAGIPVRSAGDRTSPEQKYIGQEWIRLQTALMHSLQKSGFSNLRNLLPKTLDQFREKDLLRASDGLDESAPVKTHSKEESKAPNATAISSHSSQTFAVLTAEEKDFSRHLEEWKKTYSDDKRLIAYLTQAEGNFQKRSIEFNTSIEEFFGNTLELHSKTYWVDAFYLRFRERLVEIFSNDKLTEEEMIQKFGILSEQAEQLVESYRKLFDFAIYNTQMVITLVEELGKSNEVLVVVGEEHADEVRKFLSEYWSQEPYQVSPFLGLDGPESVTFSYASLEQKLMSSSRSSRHLFKPVELRALLLDKKLNLMFCSFCLKGGEKESLQVCKSCAKTPYCFKDRIKLEMNLLGKASRSSTKVASAKSLDSG